MSKWKIIVLCIAALSVLSCKSGGEDPVTPTSTVEPIPIEEGTLYLYSLRGASSKSDYDAAVTIASAQGLLNRDGQRLYILSPNCKWPHYWLQKFTGAGGWLAGRKQETVKSFSDLIKMAMNKAKGVIIWDPEVPATLNVATTMAGVEDCLIMTRDQADTYAYAYGLKIVKDFTGVFTGSETGSAKNDAYRWAIKEFLETGKCNPHRICLFEDSWRARGNCELGYVVTRDWAIAGKCFTYDLSPWGDEVPKDDPKQRKGLDLQTYKMLLEAQLKQSGGKEMTECAGFFSFQKYSNVAGFPSSHDPVPTEWENVYLITPYNCYQNTVAHECYNQSLHSQAPQKNMKQGRPKVTGSPQNGKTYLAVLMADYDSTTPLYEFMFNGIWDDKRRGEIPLLWGINPNLSETYPDIMQLMYETKSDNDWFAADASCAGYFNPCRIKNEYLPLFVEHNKKFYQQWDMSISPMVLDTKAPTNAVKDAFKEFSPDGFATIVMDLHFGEGRVPPTHVYNGLPVTQLINNACNFSTVYEQANTMSAAIPRQPSDRPQFCFFRIVWTSPGNVIDSIEKIKEIRPDLDLEVVDAYTFFNYLKQYYE